MDASVSECTWTLSALEKLRNALYKFKTYLLTYFTDLCGSDVVTNDSIFCEQTTMMWEKTARSTQPSTLRGTVK